MVPLCQILRACLSSNGGACFCVCGVGFQEEPATIRLFRYLGYEYDARCAWSALGLVALSLLLVAWAWLRDRWLKRGRVAHLCPRCNYDLRGVAVASYPLRCAECGQDVAPGELLTRPRRTWRLLAIASLVLLSAHVTASWPEVRRDGWVHFVPSTVLVLQPMDVGAWTEAQWRQGKNPVTSTIPGKELSRRLYGRELWSWQEWILLKRVERACGARDDYGITAAQYDMAVRLHTTPAKARDEQTVTMRLTLLSDSASVSFLVDWTSLRADEWSEDELVQPAETSATVAGAIEQLFYPVSWKRGFWDITPEGVVVVGRSQQASTVRTRIYDVSELKRTESPGSCDLIDLIQGIIATDDWVGNRGSVNAIFKVSDHLVILATTRVHFEIEHLLDNLQDAVAAGPPLIRQPVLMENPRAFTIRSEYATGLLDYLRVARTISIESLRAAGPTLDDSVTEEELDACDRAAFGLLDRLRRRPDG